VSCLTASSEVEVILDRRLVRHSEAPVALALSGGGDSMALLHLAQGWASRRGRRLLALTVDHGLNTGSAGWTRFAGDAARKVGVDWRPLSWEGVKPTTGLPAAARAARHRLLAEAARQSGAAVILFGHTADDVAENALMRRGAAPTLGALREWSPSPVWPEGRGEFILRPLLGLRREALRVLLQEERISWLDDPANEDVRYARPRARQALVNAPPTPAASPHPVPQIAALARTGLRCTPDGRLILPRAPLLAEPRTIGRRILAMAAISASGRPVPPRNDVLDRLLDRIEAGPAFVASVAGARIVGDQSAITASREPGDIQRNGVVLLNVRKNQLVVWDGRFEILADADLVVGGLSGSAARLGKPCRARLAAFPAPIRPALPAIFQGGTVWLPRPFGIGPGEARPLAAERFAAAAGLVEHERDISPCAMAQTRRSSYVEALALA